MSRLFTRALLLAICFALVTLSLAPAALADRGMVPVSDVMVYGPGQKAIIAWNGEEEMLILSTDVSASGDSQVLELLPLPSQPEIKKGDFASFEQVGKLLKEHLPDYGWGQFRKDALGPAGVEIVFHEKIGAHDITVVKAADSTELVLWAESFLEATGIKHTVSSPELELLVEDYIKRGLSFFVFDLIEVTSKPKSIEPIVYRFDTDFLYYPLKISTLASGWTDINLFLLTPQPLNLRWLPERSGLPDVGEIIQFEVTEKELASIDQDIASLLGDNAWFTALSYHGDLARLTQDLKIDKLSANPEIVFDCYEGRCASEQESQAIIEAFGSTIVAYGMAITPTPCYELEAKLEMSSGFGYPPTIVLNIAAKEKPGACIECLGELPFRARIAGLTPGIYNVVIHYEGKVIGQRIVALPLLTLPRYFELPFKAILLKNGFILPLLRFLNVL